MRHLLAFVLVAACSSSSQPAQQPATPPPAPTQASPSPATPPANTTTLSQPTDNTVLPNAPAPDSSADGTQNNTGN